MKNKKRLSIISGCLAVFLGLLIFANLPSRASAKLIDLLKGYFGIEFPQQIGLKDPKTELPDFSMNSNQTRPEPNQETGKPPGRIYQQRFDTYQRQGSDGFPAENSTSFALFLQRRKEHAKAVAQVKDRIQKTELGLKGLTDAVSSQSLTDRSLTTGQPIVAGKKKKDGYIYFYIDDDIDDFRAYGRKGVNNPNDNYVPDPNVDIPYKYPHVKYRTPDYAQWCRTTDVGGRPLTPWIKEPNDKNSFPYTLYTDWKRGEKDIPRDIPVTVECVTGKDVSGGPKNPRWRTDLRATAPTTPDRGIPIDALLVTTPVVEVSKDGVINVGVEELATDFIDNHHLHPSLLAWRVLVLEESVPALEYDSVTDSYKKPWQKYKKKKLTEDDTRIVSFLLSCSQIDDIPEEGKAFPLSLAHVDDANDGHRKEKGLSNKLGNNKSDDTDASHDEVWVYPPKKKPSSCT